MIGWFPALVVGLVVFAGAAAVLRVFTPGEVEMMREGLRKVRRKIPGLKRYGTAAGAGQAP
jgi:hypothetical protein